MNDTLRKISNFFLVCTIASIILPIIFAYDLVMELLFLREERENAFFYIYTFAAVPLLFAGITITLKSINKAMFEQQVLIMSMMAENAKKQSKGAE